MNTYKNRTCLICGKTYHACYSCENIHSFQPWRTITDTRNCYKIFLILDGFQKGHISPTLAREQLNRCSLSHLDALVPPIRNTIQHILEKDESDYDKKDKRIF